MTITVIDSYSAMSQILTAPLVDRPRLLEHMLEPVAGSLLVESGAVIRAAAMPLPGTP